MLVLQRIFIFELQPAKQTDRRARRVLRPIKTATQ